MGLTNENRSYTVFVYSSWCLVILLVGGMILPLLLFNTIGGFNIVIFILVVGTANIGSYYLAKNIGLRPIRIHFDNGSINFNYLTFDLKNVKVSKTISMQNIKEFSDFNFGGDQTFKLKLQNTKNFTIYKSRMWSRKDDFEILIHDFKEYINQRHLPDQDGSVEPKRDAHKLKIEYQDFFQTSTATILLMISITLGFFIIYMALTDQVESLAAAFIVIGGVTGYIGTYISKKIN